jgi:hypothetical protein
VRRNTALQCAFHHHAKERERRKLHDARAWQRKAAATWLRTRSKIAKRETGGRKDQYSDQNIRQRQTGDHTHAVFLDHRAGCGAEQAAHAPCGMERRHDRRLPRAFDGTGVAVHRDIQRAVCRAQQ